MTELGPWVIGWAVGGAVVLIAALLLIAIIATAYGIQKQARRALAALRRIDENTEAIWTLGRTAKRANAIRDFTQDIEDRIAQIGAASGRDAEGRRQS